jgi:hypothetical protein
MTLGKGCIHTISTKQKVNSRNSTEAELVSMDDILSKAIWTKLFMKEQACKIEENTVYRDSDNAMKWKLMEKQIHGNKQDIWKSSIFISQV